MYPPTVDEMRRVARYLADEMNLHSAAGKLLRKAALVEIVVEKVAAELDEPRKTRE